MKNQDYTIKAVAFDLDGVIYFGSQLAEGARQVLEAIQNKGLGVYYLTNNSARSRIQIADKLANFEIKTTEDQIFSSGYAAAVYVHELKKKNRKNFSIVIAGTDNLKKEFYSLGMNVVERTPCDYLVVGYDTGFDYNGICLGLDALMSGAIFIACNLVANYPVENGKLKPGCGAMVGAISAAAQRKPDIVIGKPKIIMPKLLAKTTGLKPQEILMVGDDPHYDIAMADRFGCPSVLIAKDQIKKNRHTATYTISTLTGLLRIIDA